MLNQTAPQIQIEGGNYPVETWKQYLAKFVSYVQMGLFAVIFLGHYLLEYTGPNVVIEKLQENKWMALFGTFILCQNLQSMCLSSGAFEVYVDGKLQFSKLETGEMPTGPDMNRILGHYGVNFGGPAQ